jgi:hypothetical protein
MLNRSLAQARLIAFSLGPMALAVFFAAGRRWVA